MGPVVTPTSGVDPRVALATSVEATPGLYAVLVGSGMSTAAGVPTGWEVVEDLIRSIAKAERANDAAVEDSPVAWWEASRGIAPRYDALVDALAPTEAARRALLRRYFDPTLDGAGPVQPTDGHNALACLCATGRVRVIITTNFDRLIERALDQAGVVVQVIATPQSVEGMAPLVHTPVTLIKVNGDYATTELRNTPEELSEYPEALQALVGRVIDEYGLLSIGWSADYDIALRHVIERSPTRRYPTYWATLEGHVTEAGRRLVGMRGATEITTTGADEFLVDLADRVDRLRRRAIRRTRATPLRVYSHPLRQSPPPQGWSAVPLMQVRAVAMLGPATVDTCGMIRPGQRAELEQMLASAPLTSRLHLLSSSPSSPALDVDDAAAGGPEPLGVWSATPDAHQSMEAASYRLGGDANAGISALVRVELPAVAHGGSVVVTVDLAVSLARSLRLAELAMLWRDGLWLVSDLAPDALQEILPADAEAMQVEIHALASERFQGGAANRLAGRIDLSSLGAPTREIGPSVGFAAYPPSTMSEHAATELVADGIEYMALAWGYLDPQTGLGALRRELGLAT